jgi:GxxExxY protein
MTVKVKLHEEITNGILGAFYAVYNGLGYGFLEKVYENAMAYKLEQRGFHVQRQAPILVYFEGQLVGEYYADLLVEGKVIIELKAAKGIDEAHEAQLINYLKATPVEVGLLLNFGSVPEFKRKIFTNDRKQLAQQGGN